LNSKNFKQQLSLLSRELNFQKNRKFGSVLPNSEFVFHNVNIEGNRCVACGVRSSSLDSKYCPTCERQIEIGGKIPHAKYVMFSQDSGDYEIIHGVYLSLVYSLGFSKGVCFSFDSADVQKPLWRLNAYTPENETFEEIAQYSSHDGIGKNFLGYVKIDVDSLGEVFLRGIDSSLYTLSRYVTLSRLLHHFFNVHVRKVLMEKYPHAYTVLSGGDDVFIILPWSQAMKLVEDLNADFKTFCCQSKDFHFSAGIVVSYKSTPYCGRFNFFHSSRLNFCQP